jgi:adenylate cyclase
MRSLIQTTISFLRGEGKKAVEPQNVNLTDVIVSGYSTESIDRERCSDIPGLTHKHAGIFYADIANYTRLTEQDEDGTHRRLVEAMGIIMSIAAANDGRVAHLAGDAILAEFKDADSALHCAINVQIAARQWNANIPADEQVLFRIGVNFGDVIYDQGDIYGNAVNLAARLEKLAYSGGICVSESVRLKLENDASFKFVAMGKQYVKNISEPVQVFWIEFDSQQVDEPSLSSAVKVSAVAS